MRPSVLDHERRCPAATASAELAAAIVAVHLPAQRHRTRPDIGVGRGADGMALDGNLERRPLEARQLLAHVEAQLGVQRERAVVVAGLHQADPGRALCRAARRITSCMSARPIRPSCTFGSTVIGPTPAIVERSSRKLLPTISPSSSATTE